MKIIYSLLISLFAIVLYGQNLSYLQVESQTGADAQIAMADCDGCFSDIAKTDDVVFRANGMFTGNIIIAARSKDGIIFTTGDGNDDFKRMEIINSGKVSIGDVTTPGDFKLYVEDGILTEKVHVALKNSAEWADYVFEEDYKLLPLTEVENFINKNKHLPNVPSAQDVYKSGINVAKMDAKLLEKIEELTLYTIQLSKKVEELQTEINIIRKSED